MDASISNLASRCDELRTPGAINLIVSILILVGMLISYLPQHYRIVSRGTSEGISPYFVLLGVTSATSGFANILTLPQSRQDVACCKDLDTLHCMAGLLGIAQLGVQWICFAFILVLFLVFFRYDEINSPECEEAEPITKEEQPTWQTAVMVACVCFLHGLAVIIVTAIIGSVFQNHLSAWANTLGLMAAALAGIQYLPQIWTTFHLKHVGSLSIPMMCIQTPGGFLFAGSLFARLGWPGWSSWGIFLLTATMQGMLLSMAVYYEVKRGKSARAEEGEGAIAGEEEPLLRSSTSGVMNGNGRVPSTAAATTAYPPFAGEGVASPPRYTAHPENYGTTSGEVQTIMERQEADAATERQPLPKSGGHRNPS